MDELSESKSKGGLCLVKKNKSIIIAIVMLILLITFISGCKNGQLSISAEQDIDQQNGEITDPEELEQLWQDYLYDTIVTVGNTFEFKSPTEIDPVYIAMYAWFKYTSEHGEDGLALADEGGYLRLLPLDIVLEYAQRYFNLNSLDLSKIEDYYYDTEKSAFLFALGRDTSPPSYSHSNSWGMNLDKAIKNSDGSITAVLVSYDTYQTRRVTHTMTYTLKQNDKGGLYFASGKLEWINNNLVAITGEFEHFNKIIGFDGQMEELSMVGENEDMVILAYTPYAKEKSACLMLVNLNTMTVEKKLALGDNFAYSDVKLVGENIVVRLLNRVITVDKSLEKLVENPIPIAIAQKGNSISTTDEKGNPDVFFGGYDVSSDLTEYVFADEVGVKLFNTIDSSERLLSKTVPIEGSSLLDNSYHFLPRFVAQDKKVIATMSGYESTMGYTLYNLETDKVNTFNITSEGSSTGNIHYDRGTLEVNTHIYDSKNSTSTPKTLYLDFKTEVVTEIDLDSPGDTGYIRFPEYCYVGQKYASFITTKWDSSDYINNVSYINRLDLDTLTVESQIISLKAAQPHILGVLADGRILFYYNFNPSERGICITK